MPSKKTTKSQKRSKMAREISGQVTSKLRVPPMAWINTTVAQCRACRTLIDDPEKNALQCSVCHSQSTLYCTTSCQEVDASHHRGECQRFCKLMKTCISKKKKRIELRKFANDLIHDCEAKEEWTESLVYLEMAYLAMVDSAIAASSAPAECLFLKVIQLSKAGLVEEAQSTFDTTLQQVQSLPPLGGERSSLCGLTHYALGLMYYATKDLPNAERHLSSALDIQRSYSVHAPIAETLHCLGLLSYGNHKYDDALNYWREASDLAKQARDNKKYSQAQHHLGDVHCAQGNYPDSRECYLQALALMEQEWLGKSRPEYVSALCNFASMCVRDNKFDEAEKSWNDALEIIRTDAAGAFGPNHRQEGEALHCLGALNDVRGRQELAKTQYEAALAIVEANSGKDSTQYQTILNNLQALQSST